MWPIYTVEFDTKLKENETIKCLGTWSELEHYIKRGNLINHRDSNILFLKCANLGCKDRHIYDTRFETTGEGGSEVLRGVREDTGWV